MRSAAAVDNAGLRRRAEGASAEALDGTAGGLLTLGTDDDAMAVRIPCRSAAYEAHHPDPLLQRGADPPARPRRPPAGARGLRRGRVADHRRRLERQDDR